MIGERLSVHDVETLLVAFALMEGDNWAKAERVSRRDDPYSLNGAISAVERVNRDLDDGLINQLPTSAVACIYGSGGWHRYMVTADGCVHFSAHHAGNRDRECRDAQDLGFGLW